MAAVLIACCAALPASAFDKPTNCRRLSVHGHRYFVARDQTPPHCGRTRHVVRTFLKREPRYPGTRRISGWRCYWGSEGQGWCTKRHRGRTLMLRFQPL